VRSVLMMSLRFKLVPITRGDSSRINVSFRVHTNANRIRAVSFNS
jgi:hypothetical protein